MGKKIIVAGGGHGGIAAAAILSQNGFDVTVYEKNKREDMGHDWTDIFDKKGFTAAGMDIPEREKYNLKNDMTFYSTSMATALTQNTPEDQLEIQMERKDIYNHIIAHAEKAGVKFVYETAVVSPVMFGSRVAGIMTDKGETVYADLVIDAAGVNSPVRENMPAYLGVQNEPSAYERFYVYRGFYNKAAEVDRDKFKVLMFYENKPGITWVASEQEHTDVLIGRFMPFDMDEVNATLESLRKQNPSLGTVLERGGQFVTIPVRQPLGLLVCDGYAAIGDSAFMTVPIIGSGIANSFKAARLLADAVIADANEEYSSVSLWKYQRDFYSLIGSSLAPLASLKLMLTRLEGYELDYIFDNGIINADDMTIGADSTSLTSMLSGMKLDDIKLKLSGLTKNSAVLKKVARMGKEIVLASAVTAAMPKEYERRRVMSWVNRYNNCFIH